MVNKLPIKEKRLLKKQRWFYYFIFAIQDRVLVNQRTGKDIWENLHEFYLFETEKLQKWSPENIKMWMLEQLGISEYVVGAISPVYKQQLTHQVITGQFVHIALTETPPGLAHLKAVDKEEMNYLSFPRIINQHLQSLKASS
jgi:A/G-specific adenine glycosylase